jgi:hypothetical protein
MLSAIKRAIEPYERQKTKERQKILNNEETAVENFSEAKGRVLIKSLDLLESVEIR